MYIDSKYVLDVENKIKQMDYPTPKQLLNKYKGTLTKQELGGILDYFLKENKITIDKGHIVWIHNPYLTNLMNKRGFFVLWKLLV